MTEPETIERLVAFLQDDAPFIHVRFGDGDVFFLTGTGPKLTADGEEWSESLSRRLADAWEQVAGSGCRVLLGDVESYDQSDGCEEQWHRILVEYRKIAGGNEPTLVHMEALRAGRGHALPFYQAVAQDERRKVFVGPERLAGAARMLGAQHVAVPLHVAHEGAEDNAALIAHVFDPQVVLFAAGRGGKIMQGYLAAARTDLVQIDVGSGLDVLFTDLRRGTDGSVDVEGLRATYRDAGLEVE